MKTVWTPLGLKSLETTTNFIEEHWDKDVVEIFLDQLDERIVQLKMNPEIGPTYEGTQFRQLHIHSQVTLFYEINIDYVSLILVWANKQDPKELQNRLNLK